MVSVAVSLDDLARLATVTQNERHESLRSLAVVIAELDYTVILAATLWTAVATVNSIRAPLQLNNLNSM